MDTLEKRIDRCFSQYDHLIFDRSNIDNIIVGLEKQLTAKQHEKVVVEDSWKSLRLLLDKFSSESVELLQEMLNKGIKVIFDDRQYSIKIEITEHKRKSMVLTLLEARDGKVIESSIPEGIGGGVLVVLSFIFRVFLIKLYGLRPFILLDESFTQISSSYLPNFMNFMKYLIKEMNFTFLFISHDQRIHNYMDHIYRVNMGKVTKTQ